MGARQSATRMETSTPPPDQTPTGAQSPVTTLTTRESGTMVAPPQMRRVETFEEKLYRKFSEEPLVPIGALVTAYCLGSGIKSFMDRDTVRSQKMMRARVGAQFATIMIFIGYAGYSSFNLNFRQEFRVVENEDTAAK